MCTSGVSPSAARAATLGNWNPPDRNCFTVRVAFEGDVEGQPRPERGPGHINQSAGDPRSLRQLDDAHRGEWGRLTRGDGLPVNNSPRDQDPGPRDRNPGETTGPTSWAGTSLWTGPLTALAALERQRTCRRVVEELCGSLIAFEQNRIHDVSSQSWLCGLRTSVLWCSRVPPLPLTTMTSLPATERSPPRAWMIASDRGVMPHM